MARLPLHYVDLRAFCYATEDETAVERALRTFLPEDAELEREESEGFHGDRIVVLSVRLERADEMRHVLSRLREMDDADFERLLSELDQRVDEDCTFFVRLDKQAAFRGDAALGEGITLRSKVEAYPAKKATAVENVREALTEE
ncbi:MAG: RNA-binding protein [Haloarculaceae archaeon]